MFVTLFTIVESMPLPFPSFLARLADDLFGAGVDDLAVADREVFAAEAEARFPRPSEAEGPRPAVVDFLGAAVGRFVDADLVDLPAFPPAGFDAAELEVLFVAAGLLDEAREAEDFAVRDERDKPAAADALRFAPPEPFAEAARFAVPAPSPDAFFAAGPFEFLVTEDFLVFEAPADLAVAIC